MDLPLRTLLDELTDFLARLTSHPLLDTVTVPVGNGQTISYKRLLRGTFTAEAQSNRERAAEDY
jgi:hypothetical protein